MYDSNNPYVGHELHEDGEDYLYIWEYMEAVGVYVKSNNVRKKVDVSYDISKLNDADLVEIIGRKNKKPIINHKFLSTSRFSDRSFKRSVSVERVHDKICN